jgi:hypothetical protein
VKVDNTFYPVGSWEQAADSTVKEIYDLAFSDGLTDINVMIKMMRHKLDDMINMTGGLKDTTSPVVEYAARQMWAFLARHALIILSKTGNRPDPELLVELFISKQRDYGSENIAKFGTAGLLIRIHDKIARLENIMDRSSGNFNTAVQVNAVAGETIIDTLHDVVGYATIALMWLKIDVNGDRAFMYPLAESNGTS